MNTLIRNDRRDPTRTTVLRNSFAREMRVRFNRVIREINRAIINDDVFGLSPMTFQQITNQSPGRRAFAFNTSSEKVAAFMRWLNELVEREIIELVQMEQVGTSVNAAWTNIYINDSYRRGVQRARYELTSNGFNIPSLTQSGGLNAAMQSPFHIDRLGLLFTRTFNELRGVTTAMDQQISRVLAEGLADGLNPRTIARRLNAVIKGGGGDLGLTDTLGRYIPARRRAEMIARTEIIRAHAEATLQEFQNWGVEGVEVQAEWMTAGDNRVCQRCADLQGSVFTIDQARGMIPLHPSCRCAWLPYKIQKDG